MPSAIVLISHRDEQSYTSTLLLLAADLDAQPTDTHALPLVFTDVQTAHDSNEISPHLLAPHAQRVLTAMSV